MNLVPRASTPDDEKGQEGRWRQDGKDFVVSFLLL